MNPAPIAVFDSGLGGLSVVRHLRRLLPNENVAYFGDTARVPYGIKSRPTVQQFSLETASFLLEFEPKLIVAACNTASALALDFLERELPVPVIGVVKPGAEAAVRMAGGRPIAVLGTEATINSGAYREAIHAHSPNHTVIGQACPLFVPIVEEGREAEDPLIKLAVDSYLAPLKQHDIAVTVLGCTHYPLLRTVISTCLGPWVEIVDSGRETSLAVQRHLQTAGGLSAATARGTLRCYVSDNPKRFEQVGSRFLGEPVEYVELVEAERYVNLPRRTPSVG